MVFGQDNPATLSDLDQPVFILGIGGKVVVVDVERGPGLTERCATRFFSKERSRRKTGPGRFDEEFTPNGFFDFEPPASIIVCQVIHGLAGFIVFRDHGRWNAGACQLEQANE